MLLTLSHSTLLALTRSILSRIALPCGLILLPLCLFSNTGLAQDKSGDAHADTPNIYVDYGLTPASYPLQKAATNGLGCWIWAKDVLDKQTVHLWQTFKIPGFAPATN